jgi:hypothetical protein
MNGYVSPDYLFSYWIFAWFLIYYNIDAFHNGATAFIKRYFSPMLALLIALLFNVYEIVYAMYLKFDVLLFSKFAIMILLVKALPIYLLYRKGASIRWFNDFIALTIVFTIYNLYLYSRGLNPKNVYTETEKSLTNGDNKTPMFYLMDKLIQCF